MILTVALAVDRLGEPPTSWHPVGWIGKLIAQLNRRAPSGPRAQLWYGAVIALVPAALAGTMTYCLNRFAGLAPRLGRIVVRGVPLSWTFSLAELERSARQVKRDLEADAIDSARWSLRSLVSRPTAQLIGEEIAAAAIESLAENASDSVIAPLFWWTVAGPTAAAIYRAINTADSMVGYHGRYELLGRVSARLDDVVNLVPARLTGLAICAASLERESLRTMRRDHVRTESPNAGWPMSAMAGALHRRLSKMDHYVLGGAWPLPMASDIDRAIALVRRAVVLALLLLFLMPGRRP